MFANALPAERFYQVSILLALPITSTDFQCSQNSDVFKGVVSWAAGGFDTNYVITETPDINGTTLTDQPLVSQCIVAKFRGASGVL